jgi:CBS domain-containing protein
MNAGALCIRDVITAHPQETIVEVARRMARYNVGDVIVVDEHAGLVRPIGIVTDRDLVVRGLARGDAVAHQPVRDVMQADLITATVDDDVTDVIARMKRNLVRRIPIVDHRGALEGILALDDIIGWLESQLGAATALLERQVGGHMVGASLRAGGRS